MLSSMQLVSDSSSLNISPNYSGIFLQSIPFSQPMEFFLCVDEQKGVERGE